MDHLTTTGAARRDLLKGAAGLAVGAAAVTMLASEQVAVAAGQPMSLSLQDIGTFEVLAYSWGASQSGSLHVGAGGGTGRANFQDISLTKYTDIFSPALVRLVATGNQVAAATLTVTPKSGPAMSYRLRPVLVTSLSTGGSGVDFTENVTLNFGAFEYSVGSASFAFNIQENA